MKRRKTTGPTRGLYLVASIEIALVVVMVAVISEIIIASESTVRRAIESTMEARHRIVWHLSKYALFL